MERTIALKVRGDAPKLILFHVFNSMVLCGSFGYSSFQKRHTAHETGTRDLENDNFSSVSSKLGIFGQSNEYPATPKIKKLNFTIPNTSSPFLSGKSKTSLKTGTSRNIGSITEIPRFGENVTFTTNKELNDAIINLIKLCLSSFVHCWFSKISTDLTFEEKVFNQISTVIKSIFARSKNVDHEKLLTDDIINVIIKHLYRYRKAEQDAKILTMQHSTTSKNPNSNETYLSSNYKNKTLLEEFDPITYAATNLLMCNKLHPAVSLSHKLDAELLKIFGFEEMSPTLKQNNLKNISKFIQLNENDNIRIMEHIRKKIEMLIPIIQNPKYSNSKLRNLLIRESLTCAVITPLINLISDPYTMNSLLETRLEELIKEKKLFKELNSFANNTKSDLKILEKNEEVLNASKKSAKAIDNLMLSINNTNDVYTLDKILHKVVEEIRKKRIIILGHDREDIVHGELVGDVMIYLNQLYIAKKTVENKIKRTANKNSSFLNPNANAPIYLTRDATIAEQISKDSDLNLSYYRFPEKSSLLRKKSMDHYPQGKKASSVLPSFTLYEILNNADGLSAFAEFMSINRMQFCVEFWTNISFVLQSMDKAQNLQPIVNSLWKTFFARRVDELYANSELISRVQKFLKPFRSPGAIELQGMTRSDCIEAIKLMCLVQHDIYNYLNLNWYKSFVCSPLYSRFLKVYALSSNSAGLFNDFSTSEFSPKDDSNDSTLHPCQGLNNSIASKESNIRVPIDHGKKTRGQGTNLADKDSLKSQIPRLKSHLSVTNILNKTKSIVGNPHIRSKISALNFKTHSYDRLVTFPPKAVPENKIETVENIKGFISPPPTENAILTLKKVSNPMSLNKSFSLTSLPSYKNSIFSIESDTNQQIINNVAKRSSSFLSLRLASDEPLTLTQKKRRLPVSINKYGKNDVFLRLEGSEMSNTKETASVLFPSIDSPTSSSSNEQFIYRCDTCEPNHSHKSSV
ncbi:hypothetical protein BB560_001021 [Smittium megazygosporum]|uniref:RGS domain-containing protein n=1 Tax=Smittium megazygosporum TaxID=133381 RepID=A0A2T9ZIN9_9FUNG|nr:hypothetical protein BB560_001021 [Smittium megazygosporum]